MMNQVDFGVMVTTSYIAESLVIRFHTDPEKTRKIVNTSMNRLLKTRKDLIRFKKGIYYKTKMTPFGNIPIDPLEIVIKKFVYYQGEQIGYETGPSFSNLLGLSTLIPRYRYFASNNFRNRGNLTDEKLGIVLRKPRVIVNEKNYKYLQLLDLIENKEKISFDNANPITILLAFIQRNNLDFGKLLGYAKKYYSTRTVSHLAELAMQNL
jgi:hypothetical protein